jgi:2-haloacid dehalogenase
MPPPLLLGLALPTLSTMDVIVFDVNETLSDMAPLGQRFADVGADPLLATVWFAGVLRDGFARTAAGGAAPFSEIAQSLLRGMVDADAVDHVMAGFASLQLHPDVRDGVEKLARSDARLVTLTNGTADVADGLLTRGGIREHFERLLSVEDAPAWKPARSAYEYAASTLDVEPARMTLVAVHPWDVHGAHEAGLRTAWVNRDGATYPAHFAAPDREVATIGELAG